jgi:hypothetical protein
MTKVRLDIGATVDFLTKDELDSSLASRDEEQEASRLRGIKYFRLPRLYAVPSGGTVVLGEPYTGVAYTGPVASPNEGYAWSIRRLACNGLATGSVPDMLNIYRNDFSSDPVWQLNGNNFAYTFGKTELILLAGERLIAMSAGSMTATGQVSLTADAIEVPALMIGKLVS